MHHRLLNYEKSFGPQKMSLEAELRGSFQEDERTALTESDTELQGLVSRLQKTKRAYRTIILLTKSIVALLAIYGALTLTSNTYTTIRETKSGSANELCDCGNSVAEAKAMGCEFVPLAAAWLPPACRDKDLEEQFNHAGPEEDGAWKYWRDENGTRTHEINAEELGMLSDIRGYYWTTQRWHITHCMYYWLKGWRKSSIVEPRYDGESHIRHCLNVILVHLDLDFISTIQGASLTSGIE